MNKAEKKRKNQRETLNRFINPPINLLIKLGFTPNTLSICGLLCSVIVGVLLAVGGLHFPYYIAWITPFIMVLASVFDAFDGEVARRTNTVSQSGAFLDGFLDRFSDAFIIIGLVIGNYIHYVLGLIILFLTIMISYTRSRAENEDVNMKGVGLMERAERLIFLWFVFIIEIQIYFFFSISIFHISIIIYIGVLMETVYVRFWHAFEKLNKIDKYERNNLQNK